MSSGLSGRRAAVSLRLAFTWTWDDDDADTPARQLIEVEFEEHDGATTGLRQPRAGAEGMSAVMRTPYTHRRLTDVEDAAPQLGLGDVQESRFANDDLETERTGVTHHRIKPGRRQGFGHRHERAEEVYVVLAGSGRVKLDDDIVAIEGLDAIRVAPTVTRAFEAGPDGLELLAVGPRHDGDGEVIEGWWG